MKRRQKKKEDKKMFTTNATFNTLQQSKHFTIFLHKHYVTKKILQQYRKQGMKIVATGKTVIHTLQDVKKFTHPFTCTLHKMDKVPGNPSLSYDKKYKTYIKRKNQ